MSFVVNDGKIFEVGDIVEKDGKYWTTIQTQWDAINAYELVRNSDSFRVVRGPKKEIVFISTVSF